MLSIEDISLRVAGRLLIERATVQIPAGARVGLVGRNGTGKSSLFRAIAGDIALEDLALDLQSARTDDGSLNIDPSELRIVFVGLGQEAVDVPSAAAGRYIFEWGYGRWVGLEDERVRYDGGPIQNAKLLLFYGDRTPPRRPPHRRSRNAAWRPADDVRKTRKAKDSSSSRNSRKRTSPPVRHAPDRRWRRDRE
jgi:energy-coupling factor transporter ATP-binding protein EcfA2